MTAMARKQRNSNPIEHRALLKRSKVAAEGEVQPASIPLLDLSLSTIGSTAVQPPTNSTNGDNEYGGGPALSSLIAWARSNFP
jgi:hypothetical protein